MPKRKIKITCSNINGVVLSEPQTISVWVTESRDNYMTLSRNENIIEWDFDELKPEENNNVEEAKPEEEEKPEPEPIPEPKEEIKVEEPEPEPEPMPAETTPPPIPQRELTNEEQIVEVCIHELGVTDYQKMAMLLEAILVVGYRSPNLLYTPLLFQRGIKTQYDKVGNQTPSIELAVTKMVLETYYRDTNIKEALLDTITRTKPLWKTLKDYPTQASFAYKLYNKNGQTKEN